ncbi:hypothetical protein C823_000394 [Eubacterium plexicaudatum ASF492]|nr:hypothetical protein C823_000394 [Eubacterium plexicaudatum ASF492]
MDMTNRQRRDAGMAYISDDTVLRNSLYAGGFYRN